MVVAIHVWDLATTEFGPRGTRNFIHQGSLFRIQHQDELTMLHQGKPDKR